MCAMTSRMHGIRKPASLDTPSDQALNQLRLARLMLLLATACASDQFRRIENHGFELQDL
jgi:hypothetical protein